MAYQNEHDVDGSCFRNRQIIGTNRYMEQTFIE